MLDKIYEVSLFEELESVDEPIVVYGMGNGADMVMDELQRRNIKVSGIFASDEFVRSQSFRGFEVKKYTDIAKEFSSFTILMSFATKEIKTLGFIKDLSKKHRLRVPCMPVVDEEIFSIDFIARHEREFDKAYDLLADDFSKKVFINILNYKISGKPEYIFEIQTPKMDVYKDILNITDDETIVDLGAYNGDTVREIINASGDRYRHIYAFEPDRKNFVKLQKNTSELERITCLNLAAWSEKTQLPFSQKAGRQSRTGQGDIFIDANSVDNVLKSEMTFIKMDVEGSERMALLGAQKTIHNHSPKLYVCAYHRNEDFFALPLIINELNPDYKIYLRQHDYIPAWESNFYCIVKK